MQETLLVRATGLCLVVLWALLQPTAAVTEQSYDVVIIGAG